MSGILSSINAVSINRLKTYIDDYVISGKASAHKKLMDGIPVVTWLTQAQKDAVLKALSDIPAGTKERRALADRLSQEIRDPINGIASSNIARVMTEQAWAIQTILSFLRLADLSRARAVQRAWYESSNAALKMCMNSRRELDYEMLSQNARFRGLESFETVSYYRELGSFTLDMAPSKPNGFMEFNLSIEESRNLAEALLLHSPKLFDMQVAALHWDESIVTLATCCPAQITDLSIWQKGPAQQKTYFDRSYFKTILKMHANLRVLTLINIWLEQKDFQLLEQFSSANLIHLVVGYGNIQMETIVRIAQARCLQHLQIESMGETLNMTADHFRLIGDACPKLESFGWSENAQNGEEGIIQLIQRCQQLRIMKLVGDFTHRMPIAIGKHCPSLTCLNFKDNRTLTIYDHFAILQGCPMLDPTSLMNGASIQPSRSLLFYEGRSPLARFYQAAYRQQEDARKLFSALDQKLQELICFHVWVAGGRQEGDPNWGGNHLLDIDIPINTAICRAMLNWYTGVSLENAPKNDNLRERLDRYWDATGR